jgi:hypothetical protein
VLGGIIIDILLRLHRIATDFVPLIGLVRRMIATTDRPSSPKADLGQNF